ncbi:hypothetical protein B0A50_03516 [Salinomyces thailandicus]|uniref:Ubiquitin-like protease family profile domain-containing protein n=1 Tax=Salinomyces thailandicus TaxID=706561 RepID=A0A4U0U3A8_9PEZI|nr:hypothetical protein B0A50_03516 [Salinomyces thailandica]
MPFGLGTVVGGIKEALLGGYQEQQTKDIDHEEEVKVVIPVASHGGIKRSVSPGELKAEGTEKRRSRDGYNKNGKRLLEGYDKPQRATAIFVPTNEEPYSAYDRARTGAASMAPMRAHKGFKPMNRLDGIPNMAARGQGKFSPPSAPRSGDFFQGDARDSDRRATGRLSMSASAGNNVLRKTKKDTLDADAFDVENGRKFKKQKMTSASPLSGVAGDPLVLDDDEESEGNVARRQSAESIRPQDRLAAEVHSVTKTAHKSDDPMKHSFLKKQHQQTNMHSKKRRKPMSQASPSQTSSVMEIDGDSERAGVAGTLQAPLSVNDSQEICPSRANGKRRSTSQSEPRLPINLGDGVDEVTESTYRRMGRTERQDKSTGSAVQAVRSAARPEIRSESYVNHKGQQERAPSPGLRDKFCRIDSTNPYPQQKMRHRMLEKSVRPAAVVDSINDSFGSDDALQGPPTIASVANDRPSSGKPSKASQRQSASTSMSTMGTASVRRSGPDGSVAKRQKELGRGEDDRLVPMVAFYASTCMLTGDALELRFDDRTNELGVWNNGRPAVAPGKKRVLTIGQAEARKINFCHGSNRLYVTGSATDVSNGHICIAFADENDTKRGIDLIQASTNFESSMQSLDLKRLNAIFVRQCEELNKSAGMQKTHLATANYLDRYGVGQNPGRTDPEEDEESILYESHSDQSQHNQRKAMQGRNEAAFERKEQPVRSQFFGRSESARRSTRQSTYAAPRPKTPSPERWTRIHKPKPWLHSITYPPEGSRRVTVDFNDLERLDEGEFLNDNVVSLALRQIEEKVAPEQRDHVHFFNSFFYSSLTTKNGKKVFNYDAVKRWTKGKDIFSVPYIVVPICIDLHWFVAIICNLPNLSRKFADEDEGAAEVAKDDSTCPDSGQATEIDDSAEVAEDAEQDEQTKQQTKAMHKLSLSESATGSRDEANAVVLDTTASNTADQAEGEASQPKKIKRHLIKDEELESSRPSTATGKKAKQKRTPQPRKFDPDTPAIITLDSFGSAHTTEIRFLKEYLKAEAGEKRGIAFDRDALQGVTAKGIPEQTNFCDCGVYLIGYIEHFARDPRGFVKKVLSKQLDQQSDFASFDPSKKRAVVREEMLKLAAADEQAHLARKKSKKDAAKKQAENRAGQSGPAPVGGKCSGKASAMTPAANEQRPQQQPFGESIEVAKPVISSNSSASLTVVRRGDTAPAPAGTKSHDMKGISRLSPCSATQQRAIATQQGSKEEDELETSVPVPLGQHEPTGQGLPDASIETMRASDDSASDSDGNEMLDNLQDDVNRMTPKSSPR